MSTQVHLNPTMLSILSISRDKYWIFISSILQLLYHSVDNSNFQKSSIGDEDDDDDDGNGLDEYSSNTSASDAQNSTTNNSASDAQSSTTTNSDSTNTSTSGTTDNVTGGVTVEDDKKSTENVTGDVIVDENNDKVEIKKDDKPYLALGADLSDDQKNTVLSLMG